MPIPMPTPDEIIATLKKSSLKNIIVEGKDDIEVYRWLETTIGKSDVVIFPCGGRTALLEVYRRRSEFQNAKVAFAADKDMWLFLGIPPEYSGIIFSSGYSIENDAYAGSSLEKLLSSEEQTNHTILIHSVTKWFSFEVERALNGNPPLIDIHINRVCDMTSFSLSQSYLSSIGYTDPCPTIHQSILSEYKLKLRGKQLIQSLLVFLNHSNRRSRFTRFNLLELAVKNSNTLIDEITTKVLACF